MEANTIQTHGLRRVFKSRNRVVEAVVGVRLEVRKGEIFGFLGPNGAGKTSVIKGVAIMAILSIFAIIIGARAFGRAVA